MGFIDSRPRTAFGRGDAALTNKASSASGDFKRFFAGSVSRRVLMDTFEPRVLLSADLLPVAGSISLPGETDSYAITVDEPTRVTFDSLSDSQLNWRLQGPQGAVTNSRFDQSDGYNRTQPTTLDLVRGTYTLTVSGKDYATGDYAFRLIDLANSQGLQQDVETTATLTSGRETELYSFTAQDDDFFALAFSEDTSRNDGGWTLIDEAGNRIGRDNNFDGWTGSLEGGDYTLLIEGYAGATATVSASFSISLGRARSFDYSVGDTIGSAIDIAGDSHAYHFTVATDGRYALTGSSDDGTASHGSMPIGWSVRSLDGAVSSGNAALPAETSPSVLDLAAGEYWIVLEATGTRQPDYDFRLERLAEAYQGAAPDRTITTASFDTPIEGTLSRSGETIRYDFSLATETEIDLSVLVSNPNVKVALEADSGTVFSPFTADTDTLGVFTANNRLPDYRRTLQAGNYAITVSATAENAGDFALQLSKLTTPPATSLPAVLDLSLDADTPFKRIALDLTAGDELVVDILSQSYGHNGGLWRAYDPDGLEILSLRQLSTGYFAVPVRKDGTYILEIARGSAITIDELSANVQLRQTTTEPFALDTIYDVAIEPLERRDFSLHLDQPGLFLFDVTGLGAGFGDLYFSIIDADGNVEYTRTFHDHIVYTEGFPLDQGDYTVRVDAYQDRTGSAQFRLVDLGAAPLLTFGETVTAHLDPGAKSAVYAIDGDQGILGINATITGKDSSYNPNWSLLDSAGKRVDYTSATTGARQFTLDRDERYYLYFQPEEEQNQPYDLEFYVQLFQPTITDYEIDTDAVGSFPFVGGRNEYRFTLDEAKRLYLDTLQTSNANWYVFDDLGNQVGGSASGTLYEGDPTARLLNLAAGSYRLVVEPRDATDADYRFALRDFTDPQPITLGTEIRLGNADGVAESRSFELTGGERLIYDRLEGNQGQLRIYRPDGTQLFATSSGTGGDRIDCLDARHLHADLRSRQ